MIDKKKIVHRITKAHQLTELPFINLAILLIIIIEVIGEAFRIFYLQMLKPIPIILMIYYIHHKNRTRQHLVSKLIQFGLVLSLVGDVCLMINDMPSFLIGTAFFFLAHIFYIIAFKTGEKVKKISSRYKKLRIAAYVVIVILLIINEVTLWDKFPSKLLFVPYTAILALQAAACLARYEKTINSSFYFTLIGCALFAISDNLLGFLKFNEIKTDLGRSIIMITYYGAQYLIMHGALHQSSLIYELAHKDEMKNY